MSIRSLVGARSGLTALLTLSLVVPATPNGALGAQDPISLAQALETARRASPVLAAARVDIEIAAARARQAGALINPALSVEHQQTGSQGVTNAEFLATVEQTLDVARVRATRRRELEYERARAEARLASVEAELDLDVSSGYARAVAADRRVAIVARARDAFVDAARVSEARFAAGDLSGYAVSRLRLETARYAAAHSDAGLDQRTEHRALRLLLGTAGDSLLQLVAGDLSGRTATHTMADDDALRTLALQHRADLRAAAAGAAAAQVGVTLAARERMPALTLRAGLKNEQTTGGDRFSGFAAGVSLPLPLWDRNRGAIDAADGVARTRDLEVAALRLRIEREVTDAADALRTVAEQLALLRPSLGEEATAALGAAAVAYREGETTLLEWLDAVRAFHEAEVSLVTLESELSIRLATLRRAVGTTLPRETP